MEMGGMLLISADLISGKEPTVPIELMGWVGPRAGLTALENIRIFLPCLLWYPKVSFHFRKTPLVPILSQTSPVNTHPHVILSKSVLIISHYSSKYRRLLLPK
jgi:hypothetical protein